MSAYIRVARLLILLQHSRLPTPASPRPRPHTPQTFPIDDMSSISLASETLSTTQAFEKLCDIKRAIYDTKAELESGLFEYAPRRADHTWILTPCLSRALNVHTGEDLVAWEQRFLASLRERNERYRSSALRQLRNAALRARVDNAPEKLTQSLQEILDLSDTIRGEVEKVCGRHDPLPFSTSLTVSSRSYRCTNVLCQL